MGDMMTRWFAMHVAHDDAPLPSGYTRLEYITGSSAYINTGLPVRQGDRIVLKYYTGNTQGEQYIYGWRRSGTYSNPYQLAVNVNNGYRQIIAGKAISGAAIGTQAAFAFDQRNTLVIDTAANRITVNGEIPSGLLYDLSNGAAFDDNGSSVYAPYLCAFDRIGSAIGTCTTTRLYLYTVTRNGADVMHLVPAINQNGVYGMYDAVSGNFFDSANSNEFTGA